LVINGTRVLPLSTNDYNFKNSSELKHVKFD
jgi:hypothetical protein